MSKVTVLGSFNVDLVILTPRLPKPGETVIGGPFRMCSGGKGSNQAVAAKKAGADVALITKVGDDQFASFAHQNVKENGMSTDYIFKDKGHSTGVALIEIEKDTGENSIVAAIGACDHVTIEEVEMAREPIQEADVFLTQFEMNLDAVIHGMKIAKEAGVLTILNPAPARNVSDEIYKHTDIITPNETETEMLTGINVSKEDNLEKAAEYFRSKGVETVMITLGARGVYVYSDEYKGIIPAITVPKVVDTVGAGDAFNGGLACALAEGKNLIDAVTFGCVVGGLSVTREGAASSMPSREEIEEFSS